MASRDDVGSEATVEWMVGDIAVRCRAVLDALAHGSPTVHHLGSAGTLLRGAADDLVTLAALLDASASPTARDAGGDAFMLSFDTALGRRAAV